MPVGVYDHKHQIKNGRYIKRDIFCLDCGIKLNYKSGSKRCNGCAHKGKLSGSFKGGKPKCLDCGKILSRYDAKRCKDHRGNTMSAILKELYKDPKNHPNYIDGRSENKAYPQEFQNLREKIRNRDNYTCQNCTMTDEEHIVVYGTHIEIHHIDYNKENNTTDNLLTLCKACNIRANHNRTYWQDHYTFLVISRLN